MAEGTLELTDSTFDEALATSDVPVLVDFWAEWCGPCKMVAPILDEIASERAGKLRIAKLNIDDHLEVPRRYEVMSIPTMILFHKGKVVGTPIIGAKGKGQLLQLLDSYLEDALTA